MEAGKTNSNHSLGESDKERRKLLMKPTRMHVDFTVPETLVRYLMTQELIEESVALDL